MGNLLTEKMKESSEFTPIAGIRKEAQKETFEKRKVEAKLVDLEAGLDVLINAMDGMDAIVFSAGSGGNTGDDKTLTIDLDGAVKAMEAASHSGIKRFVMVSALNADNRNAWESSGLKPYYVAKHYADRFLRASGLNYTILRPGLLLDESGTGRITINDPASQKGVPREDVAELILEVLRNSRSLGKTIEFNQGDSSIREVVNRL